MMDLVTDALSLPPLIDDFERKKMLSLVIGKKAGSADYGRNKAEGMSMSISSKLLLCQLDLLNTMLPDKIGIFPLILQILVATMSHNILVVPHCELLIT